MPTVSMTVNGKAVSADVDVRTLLVQYLVKASVSPAPMSAATPRSAGPG